MSSAAAVISATYWSCSAGVSGAPYSSAAARPESTSAACTQMSSAGSPAAYGRPVTGSMPFTRSCTLRTRAAAARAAARSP